MYGAKIIADSVNLAGNRITTFELTYPRFVHAELMTHRQFSRNSASSRAIPVEKLMQRIREHPVMPKYWGKNQRGMEAAEELQGDELENVKLIWLDASRAALAAAERLSAAGLHKQIANRVLEPWMFITVIVTATSYNNWFGRRCSPHAQPEIAWVAWEMKKLYDAHKPTQLATGEWHLPYVETMDTSHDLFVSPSEPAIADDPLGLAKISAARCARVSYLTHDGKRDLSEDLTLCQRLTTNGHWSPLEHPALALPQPVRAGNFVGWQQYRKWFPGEDGEVLPSELS